LPKHLRSFVKVSKKRKLLKKLKRKRLKKKWKKKWI
jgi:hypothetical protein